MAISSITYTETDILATDDLTTWGGFQHDVNAAGAGPTSDYTAYTVGPDFVGGPSTCYINLDKVVANANHYLEFWVKSNLFDTARGYGRISSTNYASTSVVLYGNGTPTVGSGFANITDLDTGWTLWGIDLGVIPAGTLSVRFGPNDVFTVNEDEIVTVSAPRLHAGTSSGWTITEGDFTTIGQGKTGIIGRPMRGKM